MLISYDRPADISFFVTGAAAITADLGVMANGRPNQRARFTWPTGPQTTSTSVRVYATWGALIALGAVGIIGCTLPSGTRVDLFYASAQSPTDVAIASHRLQSHPLGWRSVVFDLFHAGITPPLDDTDSVMLEIFNDVNGVASIVAGSVFEIGEVWVGKGAGVPINEQLSIGYENRAAVEVSIYAQPWLLPDLPRRRFTASASLMSEAVALGRAADIEQVNARLLSHNPVLVIPAYRDKTGAFSQALVDATAMLGYFEQVPALVHVEARYYQTGEYVFFEAPVSQ